VGVCIATSGPGAIHLLNGLYDARLDSAPVMAIVGQQASTAMGTDYQQEVDLVSLFKDVARDYVHMATTPGSIRHLIDRALRIARPGVNAPMASIDAAYDGESLSLSPDGEMPCTVIILDEVQTGIARTGKLPVKKK